MHHFFFSWSFPWLVSGISISRFHRVLFWRLHDLDLNVASILRTVYLITEITGFDITADAWFQIHLTLFLAPGFFAWRWTTLYKPQGDDTSNHSIKGSRCRRSRIVSSNIGLELTEFFGYFIVSPLGKNS